MSKSVSFPVPKGAKVDDVVEKMWAFDYPCIVKSGRVRVVADVIDVDSVKKALKSLEPIAPPEESNDSKD